MSKPVPKQQKPRDKEAAASLKRERQAVIFDSYYKQRKTFREIGQALGFSDTYARQLLDEMKAESLGRYESRVEDLVEDELELLQQREQHYLEALESSRAKSQRVKDIAEPTGGSGSGAGSRMRTVKSMRTRKQKPLDTRPIDGLMRVSNARIKLVELKLKIEEANAGQKSPRSSLEQVTPEERAIAFVNALAAMAARADAEEAARQEVAARNERE